MLEGRRNVDDLLVGVATDDGAVVAVDEDACLLDVRSQRVAQPHVATAAFAERTEGMCAETGHGDDTAQGSESGAAAV